MIMSVLALSTLASGSRQDNKGPEVQYVSNIVHKCTSIKLHTLAPIVMLFQSMVRVTLQGCLHSKSVHLIVA